MRTHLTLLAGLALAACGTPPDMTGATGGGGDNTGAGGGGGDMQAPTDLPCDVATFVSAKCDSCHGDPQTNAAPFSLLSYADFAKDSPQYPGTSVAQRSLIRLKQMTAQMPPSYATAATGDEINLFESWVNNGMQKGTCTGMQQMMGPPQLTCASGTHWAYGDSGSTLMNPGLACRACHLTKEPFRAYYFMGTVYPGLHEEDLCNASGVANTMIEILDMSGAVQYRLYPNAAGNFFTTSRTAGFTMPYRVRVTAADGHTTSEMQTPQTDGDCNSCHTAVGANGAPGRIMAPRPPQ